MLHFPKLCKSSCPYSNYPINLYTKILTIYTLSRNINKQFFRGKKRVMNLRFCWRTEIEVKILMPFMKLALNGSTDYRVLLINWFIGNIIRLQLSVGLISQGTNLIAADGPPHLLLFLANFLNFWDSCCLYGQLPIVFAIDKNDSVLFFLAGVGSTDSLLLFLRLFPAEFDIPVLEDFLKL